MDDVQKAVFDNYTKEDWKATAENFLYALEHGDGELAEYMCNKYGPYLAPVDGEDDYYENQNESI